MQPPVEFRDTSADKAAVNATLRIDPRRTAVLTVDMQRNYLDMQVAHSPVDPDEAERVLRHAKDLLDFARAEGMPVVHVYVSRRPFERDRRLVGAVADVRWQQRALREGKQPPPDRAEGSPQAEVPAMLVAPGDIHVTTKKSLDSFLETDLDPLLRRALDVDTLIITGINTDTCVYCATFGASNRGYRPIVVSDCVASSRGKDAHWMALELMSRSIAWVLTADELKDKVRANSAVLAGAGAP